MNTLRTEELIFINASKIPIHLILSRNNCQNKNQVKPEKTVISKDNCLKHQIKIFHFAPFLSHLETNFSNSCTSEKGAISRRQGVSPRESQPSLWLFLPV